MQQIKTALVSVSNKEGIVELCQFLEQGGVRILSTGGTYKLLCENGIKAIEVANYTKFPEMMDGRLKTLHPKIHGGLLNRKQDIEIMQKHEILEIDLTIVNLYPFEETLAKTQNYATIIENIDIGGPSMVRSTAKNHQTKTIITNKEDYQPLVEMLKNNNFSTSLEFRQQMAGKAFALTAYYDSIIAEYFSSQFEVKTSVKTIGFSQKKDLRYGENPHQKAYIYSQNKGLMSFVQLNGKELSYNNLNDVNSAFNVCCFFEEPTCTIVKHATPCGIACEQTPETAYQNALDGDKTSAFGGIVAINRKVEKNLAEEMVKHFFEVIIAPEFSKEALEILQKKKNLRLLKVPFQINQTHQHQFINGGLLSQERDVVKITEGDFTLQNGTMPPMENLIFGFSSIRFLKSNAILITEGKKFISFGSGQTSRIDAMKIALEKAKEKGANLQNCILFSDAFFPFPDSIALASQYGVKNIVAPCGSIKDPEVTNSAKEFGINLIFTKTRHFAH